MKEFVMKLRILLRAEIALFKADAQRRANTYALTGLSIGCVLVALVFVNLGAFFYLTDSEIDSRAAFILAACNLGVAIVPLLLRQRGKPGPEEQMVREIREMSLEEVTKDIDKVAEEFAAVGATVNQVRSGVSAFTGSGGMGGLGGGLQALGPFLGMAISMLKKKK
jgi:hypothetical protein